MGGWGGERPTPYLQRDKGAPYHIADASRKSTEQKLYRNNRKKPKPKSTQNSSPADLPYKKRLKKFFMEKKNDKSQKLYVSDDDSIWLGKCVTAGLLGAKQEVGILLYKVPAPCREQNGIH